MKIEKTTTIGEILEKAPEKAKIFEVFTPALTRPAGCAQTISHLQIPLAIEINYSAAGVFNWLGILRAFNGF